MPSRASSTSFKPGQSGNPNGRPRLPAEILDMRALAGVHTVAALDVFIRHLNHKDYWIACDAAKELLNRAHGKVVERKELTGADGGKIQIEDSTPSIRLLLQQALDASAEPKMIEGEKDG